VTFGRMHELLLDMVRERVRNGELTESRLARMTGVSQPHIHNVLKGVRILSTELADEILRQLSVTARDVFTAGLQDSQAGEQGGRRVGLLAGALGPGMRDFQPERQAGTTYLTTGMVAASAYQPLAARLAADPACAPRFAGGDLALIDLEPTTRAEIDGNGVYVVMTHQGPRLRYVRVGGERVYLPSEQTIRNPAKWEAALAEPSRILEIVRGRVVWVSRQLEAERPA